MLAGPNTPLATCEALEGDCAIAGGSPLVLGAALAAALWTRRRPAVARP